MRGQRPVRRAAGQRARQHGRAVVDLDAVRHAALAKDRAAGRSWGYLAARYGITEGTARAAYVAATGQPWQTLDYRRAARQEA